MPLPPFPASPPRLGFGDRAVASFTTAASFTTKERLGTDRGLFPLRAVDRKEGPYRYRLSQPLSVPVFDPEPPEPVSRL